MSFVCVLTARDHACGVWIELRAVCCVYVLKIAAAACAAQLLLYSFFCIGQCVLCLCTVIFQSAGTLWEEVGTL